jgi:hypothetical protein
MHFLLLSTHRPAVLTAGCHSSVEIDCRLKFRIIAYPLCCRSLAKETTPFDESERSGDDFESADWYHGLGSPLPS